MNGENSDRLPAHPINIETESRLNCCTTLRSGPLDEQHVACGINANRAGFGGKTIEQTDERGGRNISQRSNGNSIARFGARNRRVHIAASDSVADRNEAIAHGVSHHRHTGQAQRSLENEKQIRPGYGSAGRETYRALHARIDGVSHLKNITEYCLCDRCDRSVFKI